MVAVLEHMKSPKDTIERIASWLKPGGLLVVQVPYIAPYIRLKRWVPTLPIFFEAPRHLFDFSPSILQRYFDVSGFGDVQVEISRPYSSPTRLGANLIWAVKAAGLLLYAATLRTYIFPFAGALVAHGLKKRT